MSGARRLAVLATLAAMGFLGAPVAAQSPDPPPIPMIYSSIPMTRNAELTFAAIVLIPGGVDALIEKAWSGVLRRDSAGSRLARVAKLAAFDLPVVWYFVGLNHEYGHITRADEQGLPLRLDLAGTPWSATPFKLWALDERIFENLGIQSGGHEASGRLKDVGENWMRRQARIPPAHALAVIAASLESVLYATTNLTRHRLGPAAFDHGPIAPGDDVWYVTILARQRAHEGIADVDLIRRQVRARALLNLIDFAWPAAMWGVIREHIWTGRGDVSVRWLEIGPVGFIPSAGYELTPAGPEYSVRSHYRHRTTTGLAYVRWTEPIGAARQTGAGFSVAPGRPGRMSPHVDVDVWSHTVDGRGLHAGAGVELIDWPSRRAALNLSAGAKSAGYLSGYPLDRGAYVAAGFAVRVR